MSPITTFITSAAEVRRTFSRCGWLLALLLLAATAAHAQAPVWAGATSGSLAQMPAGSHSVINATATDPATGNVYVTGVFMGRVSFGATSLTSVGSNDVFVAKWDATANAWTSAVRGGGTGNDVGFGIAVVSAGGVASIYVTGFFESLSNTTIAGTVLPGAGGSDAFVAKYTDSGAGLSTTGGGAVSGGGGGNDFAYGIAVLRTGSTTNVYVTGSFVIDPTASFAGTVLASAGGRDMFVAKYTDSGAGLSTTGGGAVSDGGTNDDFGFSLAAVSVGGVTRLYVAGTFYGSASIAGTALVSAGSDDVFVAKYTDTAAGLSTLAGGAMRGGGTGSDRAGGLAAVTTGSSTSVYVTGAFIGSPTTSFAGTALPGAGDYDIFVAKYTDSGTGLSTLGGGAVSGGGLGYDTGQAIVAARTSSGTTVYVVGSFRGFNNATIAGTALPSAGGDDIFVAKYTDAGTGLSTLSGGAVSGGGLGYDTGYSIALAGQRVYVGGSIEPPATFGSTTLTGPTSGDILNVLARVNDATLTPLATRSTTVGGAGLALYPNPASGTASSVAHLSGAAPGAAVQVLDALGRPVLTTTADADGAATLRLPAGLAPGVYIVHAGSATTCLAVE